MGSDCSNLHITASRPTTLGGAPVLDLQHEEAWGDGPGYGGVGRLLRRRRSSCRFGVQAIGWSLCVVDPGENPRFRFLAGTGDGDVLDVSEGTIEVKLPAPPSILQRKP
jgi:hypothetical protein